MPEIRPEVDAEAVVVSYLNQDADFLELAGGPKASTELPRNWTPDDGDPVRLRVTRVGGTGDGLHLDRARIQIDGFADGSDEASALVRLALARLLVISTSGYRHPGAVVTGSRRDLALTRRDDESTKLESYYAAVILFVHPSAV